MVSVKHRQLEPGGESVLAAFSVAGNVGFHNEHWEESRGRLIQAGSYKDCSTIIVTPAIEDIAPIVHLSHMALIRPMNQKVTPIVVDGAEVADAYNRSVAAILSHPELSKWKYMLTIETDNIPPPDGLLKLIEDIESGPYDAVGGLYWTKGEGGMPMCYGSPERLPPDFMPWLPPVNSVIRCNGLGMGFTLFRLSYLKDERFEGQWFRTVAEWTPGVGASQYTQDLWHFQRAGKLGYKFACSTRVLVGHYDKGRKIIW